MPSQSVAVHIGPCIPHYQDCLEFEIKFIVHYKYFITAIQG